MAKRIFTIIVGILLFVPMFAALCSDSLLLAAFSVIYGICIWYSPSISPRVRRFWRDFHRENLRMLNKILPEE